MRITDKVLNDNFLRNLSRNLNQVSKYQNQLSSGKIVSRPSDAPLLVAKIMSMDINISQNQQYNNNITASLGWVKTQDTALADATSTLQRIKDLIIYGSNGTLSDIDRQAIVAEVKMKADELSDILNTNFDGRYIFAGQMTTTKPFTRGEDGAIIYNGDDKDISREISQGVEIPLLTAGNRLLMAEGIDETNENRDLGVLLKNVIAALEAGDSETLSGEDGLLGFMEEHVDNVVRVRTQIGAIHNRLEAAEERNKAENMNLKEILSQREDVDIAEKYMEYLLVANTYQASLSIGARILQPSLLDYLR